MAGSPYATLAGVLQADVKAAREAFIYHTSRHQCREGECEVREAWSLVRDITTEWLEAARSSPAPERSVTFTMLPPELAAQLAQSGGDT